MKKYKTVLFDLDGTISNTSEGILFCLKKVFVKYGINPDDYNLYQFIGPPLLWTFNYVLGDGMDQFRALEDFRKEYADHMYDNTLYDGVEDLLIYLKGKGYTVGVATSKYEPMAYKVLEKLGVLGYFDFVYGALENRGEKDEILHAIFTDGKAEKSTTVLIGDTFYDLRGAQREKIDAIAVTYGFGKREDFDCYSPVTVCDTARQIKELF